MVKDFKLPVGRLYVKNGKVFQYAIKMIFNYMGYPEEKAISKEIDLEKLRLWLEEATKPRFKVVQPNSEIWSVVNNNSNWIMASFFKEEGFDAKKEAKMLCERLNRSG